jgi:hypothetical protein
MLRAKASQPCMEQLSYVYRMTAASLIAHNGHPCRSAA